jgi:hypothetical protein
MADNPLKRINRSTINITATVIRATAVKNPKPSF